MNNIVSTGATLGSPWTALDYESPGAPISMPHRDSYDILTSADDPAFSDLYRIYTTSLPPREQKPREQLQAMIARSDYRVVAARSQGVVVGFSILFLHDTLCLLEYLAVDPARRNMGLGAALFRHSLHLLTEEQGQIPLLLEVDSDRDSTADRTIRRRRLDFYRRLGCRRIDGLAYLLPLPGEGEPPAMDLLAILPMEQTAVAKHDLKEWLKTIYRHVYACSQNDPRIEEMLDSVDDPTPLT